MKDLDSSSTASTTPSTPPSSAAPRLHTNNMHKRTVSDRLEARRERVKQLQSRRHHSTGRGGGDKHSRERDDENRRADGRRGNVSAGRRVGEDKQRTSIRVSRASREERRCASARRFDERVSQPLFVIVCVWGFCLHVLH